MIVKTDELQGVKLKMWEKVMMPHSEMDKETKKFKKTGEPDIEMTKYTFRDESGEVLELTSKENGYRSLEGEIVNIYLDIKLNQFTKKLQTKLARIDKFNLAGF